MTAAALFPSAAAALLNGEWRLGMSCRRVTGGNARGRVHRVHVQVHVAASSLTALRTLSAWLATTLHCELRYFVRVAHYFVLC